VSGDSAFFRDMAPSPVIEQSIESRILVLRGQRVIPGLDLARLYDVEVKALNQAVRRNADRFPADFMFQLTWEETQSLRSQFVTLKDDGARRTGRHAKYRLISGN
jgi:hypothetical protein